MNVILAPIIEVLMLAINIYVWLVIASAILSWLVAFNVVNTRNQFIYTVGDFLHRITEPALRPIRRFLPNLHYHRFWVESEKRWVRLRVSAGGMRIIDKKGIDRVLSEIRARGEKV